MVYVFPIANSQPYNSQEPFCNIKEVVPEAVLKVLVEEVPNVTSNRNSSRRCKTCRSLPISGGDNPSVEVFLSVPPLLPSLPLSAVSPLPLLLLLILPPPMLALLLLPLLFVAMLVVVSINCVSINCFCCLL